MSRSSVSYKNFSIDRLEVDSNFAKKKDGTQSNVINISYHYPTGKAPFFLDTPQLFAKKIHPNRVFETGVPVEQRQIIPGSFQSYTSLDNSEDYLLYRQVLDQIFIKVCKSIAESGVITDKKSNPVSYDYLEGQVSSPYARKKSKDGPEYHFQVFTFDSTTRFTRPDFLKDQAGNVVLSTDGRPRIVMSDLKAEDILPASHSEEALQKFIPFKFIGVLKFVFVKAGANLSVKAYNNHIKILKSVPYEATNFAVVNDTTGISAADVSDMDKAYGLPTAFGNSANVNISSMAMSPTGAVSSPVYATPMRRSPLGVSSPIGVRTPSVTTGGAFDKFMAGGFN